MRDVRRSSSETDPSNLIIRGPVAFLGRGLWIIEQKKADTGVTNTPIEPTVKKFTSLFRPSKEERSVPEGLKSVEGGN